MIKYKNREYSCNLDLGLEMIRGKWKALVICHLKDGPIRYLELQRKTKGVTQKMLTEQLRALEEEGIVKRTTYQELPPKVLYELTEKGKELIPVLDLIELWAEKHMK